MGRKNIRVTFTELDDVKSFMAYQSQRLADMMGAYRMLGQFSMRPNSAALVEARRDILHNIGLMIDVMYEFERLHTGNCPCPLTQERITEVIEDWESKQAEYEAEVNAAGEPDENPEHAMEDLNAFLIGTGMMPEGMPPATSDALRRVIGNGYSGGDDQQGTGLYL